MHSAQSISSPPSRRSTMEPLAIYFAWILCLSAKFYRFFRAKFTWTGVIYCVTWLVLASWTIYNAALIDKDYEKRSTMINLDYRAPNKTTLPAISICGPSIFSPAQLAVHFADFNETYQQFLQDQRNNIGETQAKKRERHGKFRHYTSLLLRRYSAIEVIEKHSLQLRDLINSCTFHMINNPTLIVHSGRERYAINCADIRPAVQGIYLGRKCFTFFSNAHPIAAGYKAQYLAKLNTTEPMKQVIASTVLNDFMHYDLSPTIELSLGLSAATWAYMGSDTSIIFGIHPANQFPNVQDLSFYRIKLGAFYEVDFLRYQQQLLRFPWQTACVNGYYKAEPEPRDGSQMRGYYDQKGSSRQLLEIIFNLFINREQLKAEARQISLWKRHRHLFQNRDECMSGCIVKHTYRQKQCADHYAFLNTGIFHSDKNPVNLSICGHHDQNYTSYMKAYEHCSYTCPNECFQPIYHFKGRYFDIFDDEDFDEEDGDFRNCLAFLDFDKCLSSNYDLQKQQISQRTFHKLKSTSFGRMLSARQKASKDFWKGYSKYHTKVSISMMSQDFLVVQHRPQVTIEELNGTIGGHLGIWLELSVFTIVSILVRFAFSLLKFVFIVLKRIIIIIKGIIR